MIIEPELEKLARMFSGYQIALCRVPRDEAEAVLAKAGILVEIPSAGACSLAVVNLDGSEVFWDLCGIASKDALPILRKIKGQFSVEGMPVFFEEYLPVIDRPQMPVDIR